MYKICIALLAAVVFAGCSKGENGVEPIPGGDHSGEIRIDAAIDVSGETKAQVTESTALTGIHFLKVDAAAKPANMTGAAAFTGKRAGDATGAITWTAAAGGTAADADKPKYDKTGNKNAYLVGVYPGPNSTEATAKGVVTTGSKVAWTIDGKTDILVSPIWDAGTYAVPLTGSAAPKLTFGHQLAQLCVVLKAETGVAVDVINAVWGNITEIALETLPTATYTYATAEAAAVTYGGSAAFQKLYNAETFGTDFVAKNVPASTNTATTASGMFAPSTGEIKIRITSKVGTGAATTHIAVVQLKNAADANQNFTKGLKHTVTLTMKVKDKEIAVTGTSITDWLSTGSGSADIGTPPAIGDFRNGGIVYEVTDATHYKVFSLDQDKLKWSAINTYLVGAAGQSKTDSKGNVAAMKAYSADNTNNSDDTKKTTGVFATDFPAAYFCDKKNIGSVGDWYLPADRELVAFYDAYLANKTVLDAAITANGGTAMNDDFYWTSTEATINNAWAAFVPKGSTTSGTSGNTKTHSFYVRCVRVK